MKIMGGMDIAEKRLPQERPHPRRRRRRPGGRLPRVDAPPDDLRREDRPPHPRQPQGVPPLESSLLGSLARGDSVLLKHQHGMILVVGPTGSGKTTTLCSALTSVRWEDQHHHHRGSRRVPDSGVNQTQINDKIKLTFASALRSILRRPGRVLVGEIRDQETRAIAMQGADGPPRSLDAPHRRCAVVRDPTDDIGIEPYVSASALIGVIAQRLMPPLLHALRRPYTPDARRSRG